MSYLDWLRNGSEFHKIHPARGGGGFQILPANNTPECRQQFDEIVRTAITSSYIEGYDVEPHEDRTRGDCEYDSARITFEK